MPAIFKEIIAATEFGAVVDCMWESYSDPYISIMQILCPIFDNTEEEYQTSLTESKTRLWAQHTSDPSSRWVAVVDSETGAVLAGAHWNFHRGSPFINGPLTLVATWYPEGEGRQFANHVINQVYGNRGTRAWRPHARMSSHRSNDQSMSEYDGLTNLQNWI
jgi:hypothetical protein